MTMLVVLARILLVVVFAVSAVAKLRDRPGTRTAVGQVGVPASFVGPVAASLPVVELSCAALLLTGDPGATAGAAGSLLLLLAFTVAVVVNLRSGRRFACHCFGQASQAEIGWPTVARNVGLMIAAGVCLLQAGSLGGLPQDLAAGTRGDRGLWTVMALLAAAVTVLTLTLRTLVTRYGAVLLRLEALEVATGTAVPVEAPPFSLPTLDGGQVDLDTELDRGKPVLAVFISPTCDLCSQLLPDLAAWQADPDHPASVVVLSTGDGAANRAKLDGAGVRVGLQVDGEVATAYGVEGTPAAFVIGTDGLVAGKGAYGVDGVLAQHAVLLQALGPAGLAGPAAELHQVGPRPVSVGDPLPDLELTTEQGDALDLDALSRPGTVLLFWRTTCGFCAEIAADVVDLEQQCSVSVITDSRARELRDSGLRSPVLRESAAALSIALRVPGTPTALWVRDGIVASAPAIGGQAVLDLLREAALAESVGVVTASDVSD